MVIYRVMEIVVSLNETYLMPATVMLCSLYENNTTELIRVHVLLKEKNEKCISILEEITRQYAQVIRFYEVGERLPLDLPLGMRCQNDYITIESYYRLFVAEILPPTIDKVLYLDCDIIICKDISDLWRCEVKDVAIAAAPTTYYNSVHVANRLGYDVHKGYFNAGVLLINLKYWRGHQAKQKFMSYIQKNSTQLYSHDQDVLNYVWQDEKAEIPIKFNLVTSLLFKDKYREICFLFDEEIRQAFDNPTIIHYTEDKPWYKNCVHPLRRYFEEYKNKTIWKDVPLKRKRIKLITRLKQLVLCVIRKEWSYYVSNYDDYYRKHIYVGS